MASMLPTHLLLLQRIATAEDLTGVDMQQTQLCQLHPWALQEAKSSRLCSRAEKQELVKHIAAATSNCLKQLDSLSDGTFEFESRPPMCICETLDLFCFIMSDINSEPAVYDEPTNPEQLAFLEAVRSQVLQTGTLRQVARICN